MPCLTIQTNVTLPPEKESALLAAASSVISATLGKPEAYVMVALTPHRIRFAGSEQPAAFLELKSIGLPAKLNTVAGSLTTLAAEHLGIPAARVFIVFGNIPPAHWAHQGETFA